MQTSKFSPFFTNIFNCFARQNILIKFGQQRLGTDENRDPSHVDVERKFGGSNISVPF